MLLTRYLTALNSIFSLALRPALHPPAPPNPTPAQSPDLNIVFIIGNQTVDLDSFIGSITWTLLQNFKALSGDPTPTLTNEAILTTIETLEIG
jgi:hypothetical protein